jgi:hypothetical protein
VLGGGAALAVLFGVGKILYDFRAWRESTGRDLAPWERS